MGWTVNLPLSRPTVAAVSHQVDNTSGQVRRLSVRETGGTTTAKFRLWDGSSPTTGTLIDTISLSAGQSTRDWYPDWVYPFDNGLYLQVISGTIEGVAVVHHPAGGEKLGMPVIIVGQLDINIGG